MNVAYKVSDTESLVLNEAFRHMYLTAGYGIELGDDFYIKPSFMTRYVEQQDPAIDLNVQLAYKEFFWLGSSYRLKNAVAFLACFRISNTFSFCYSYDVPLLSSPAITKGSHEISISIDSYRWIKRNSDRAFKRKKKEEVEGLRSIRYF